MALPSEKFAQSLEVLHAPQEKGLVALKSNEIILVSKNQTSLLLTE
jgi:hypothetical protein